MPIVYHMVHYRRFDGMSNDLKAKNLESVCRQALSTTDPNGTALWERAPDRMFDLKDGTGRQILLNKVADLSSAVAGEMCLVQTQGLQALLELSASKVQLSDLTMAEIYNLNEKAAPAGTQFIRGMAYWMAIGNHLFFVKTQSLTADLISSYLDWMLKYCSHVLARDSEYRLQAEFDKSEIPEAIGDVRSLRVSGTSTPHRISVADDELEEKTIGTSRLVK